MGRSWIIIFSGACGFALIHRACPRGGFAGRELPGEGQSCRRPPLYRAPPSPPGTYLVHGRSPPPPAPSPRPPELPRGSAPASAGPTLHPPTLNSLLPLGRGAPRFRRCRACGAAGGARGGCASIAALHKAIWFLNRRFRCDYGNTRIM